MKTRLCLLRAGLLTGCCLLLSLGPTAAAPGLSIFSPNRNPTQPSPSGPNQTQKSPTGMRQLALRGSMALGAEHTVLLAAPDGRELALSWRSGMEVPVPGFSGLLLVEAGPRRAKLRLPPGQTCQADEERGVRCESASDVVLSLVQMPALVATEKQSQPAPPHRDPLPMTLPQPTPSGPITTLSPEPKTDEAAAARAQVEALKKARYQEFSPKRIEPGSVPPGMRLVQTPFGDYLAPDSR